MGWLVGGCWGLVSWVPVWWVLVLKCVGLLSWFNVCWFSSVEAPAAWPTVIGVQHGGLVLVLPPALLHADSFLLLAKPSTVYTHT